MNLSGKIAVVTGASDGLGRQVALKLASEGVKLALLARNGERLNEVKNECLGKGAPKVEVYICDISNFDQIKDATGRIVSDFGSVDILLNIAGIWQKLNQLEDISDDEINSVIDINLKGLIKVTREILPVLKKQNEAAIINVCSNSGVVAKAGQSVYSASKWGVTGFTNVLKEDLKGTAIRVAGVYQAGTHTALFDKADDPKDPEKFAKFTEPQDLADVIVFMLGRPPKIWLHDVRVEY